MTSLNPDRSPPDGDCESVLELIYEEFMARRDAAMMTSHDLHEVSNALIEEFRQRFPELRSELEKLFQVDKAFASLQFHSPSQTVTRTRGEGQPVQLGFIGEYRLLEEVGRGGMGVVYCAVQESLGRTVALKTLDGVRAFDQAEMERLRSEAELASKLQHPNIVQIFEVGTFEDVPFFSMEYVAGGNLADTIGKQPLHPDACAKLVAVIARAVDHAHRQGVVHRDLKPSNILLAPSSRPEALTLIEPRHTIASGQKRVAIDSRMEPKVADFGLAIGYTGADLSESRSLAMGTPSYMAPELLENHLQAIGPACDIYSLGAILYDLLSGRPPFHAATLQETLELVRTEEPISLRQLQPRLPRDVETICLKCLRKDPSLRYESAEELADDLNRFVKRLPIRARPASAAEKGIKWVRRHPTGSMLLVSLAIALIAITWLWKISEESRISEQHARERGEQLIYTGKIALAQHEFSSQDIERCRALLEECDPKFRNWEWSYLKNLTEEPIWESHSSHQAINVTALSHDGSRVAIGRGAWNVNQEQSIEVWDIQNNKMLWQLEGHPESEICDVHFSPDGRTLVSSAVVWGKADEFGKVIVWDLEKGIQKYIASKKNARVARITPDGEGLIVAATDGTLTLLRLQTGEKIREWRKHKQNVFDLSFGPDQKFATCSRDGLICIWDRDLELNANVEGMGDTRKISWSPDGREIRVYNYDGIARKFSIKGTRFHLVDSENTSEFRFERFSPDGMYVATAEFGLGVRIRHSRDDGAIRTLHGHRGHVNSLSFDGPGSRIATGGSDGSVRVWDLSKPEPNTFRGTSSSATVNDIAFHPTRPEIAVAMRKTHTRPDSFSGPPRVEIWDTRKFRIKKTFLGHKDWLTCVNMNDTGTRLISGSHDKTARIWNSIDGASTIVFDEHAASILDASFAGPEDAASIDTNSMFLLWNQETGRVQKRANILDATIKLAELSPVHGLVAAVSSNDRMVVWDWNREKIIVDKEIPFAIRAVAISSNRKWIAVAGQTTKILLWDLEQLIQSPNTLPSLELDGHSDLVTSLCFSPDCQRLISSGNDETVRMFELSQGRELLKLEGLRGVENIVAMSPDGSQLLRFSQRRFRAWNKSHESSKELLSGESLAEWHHDQARNALQEHNVYAAQFHSARAVEQNSENAKFWDTNTLSEIYAGQWDAAEIDVRRAIEVEPTGRRQSMLGRALIAQGKISEYQQHCRYLEEMVATEKDSAVVNGAAWICSFSPESGSDFEKWIARIAPIAKAKRSPHYWNTLALLHCRAKHYSDSIRCANESMKLGIANSAPFDWLVKALCYVEQEHSDRKEAAPVSQKQSTARRKEIKTQLAALQAWFDGETSRINLGLESKMLHNYEKSFVIPMLLRELHMKMDAAGIAIEDEDKFRAMIQYW